MAGVLSVQKRYGADIYDIYSEVIEGQGGWRRLRFGGDGDDLKRQTAGKPCQYHRAAGAQPNRAQ